MSRVVETPNQQQETNNINPTTSNNNNSDPTATNNYNDNDDHTTTNNNHEIASEYTVPTAVAPPAESPLNNNQPPTGTSAPLLQGRVRRPQPQQAKYPNLKVPVKQIVEGTYLLPLRRQPPLHCQNPGQSSKLHPPLVIVAPEAENPQALSLSSNHCSQLMRKAKNFTAGVSRSTTGTKKQRRYNRLSSTKRKRSDSVAPSETNSPDSNQQNNQIHVVTSFALRTLLLEDIWFIEEETAIVLFFDEALLPPRYGKRLLTLWRETEQSQFLPTVSCQGRSYKQLSGWVQSNQATKKKITEEGVKTYDQVMEALSEFNHNGLYLRFPIFSAIDCNISFPPQACIQQLISWFELYTYPQGVFLQADYHPERTWLPLFKQLKAQGDDRVTLFHRLIQESTGDRYMMAELKSVWERCQAQQDASETKAQFENKIAAVQKQALSQALVPPPIIDAAVVAKFCEKLDERLNERLDECFGRFNNIFDKFLSEYELRALTTQFEHQLPQQFNAIMGMSGYLKKIDDAPATDKRFLRKRYSLDAFFQFIVRARKHNNHLLVPFGMLFALAQYACGHGMLALQIPIWFGISVSKRTMERRVAECLKTYDQKVQRSLRNVTNLLAVFDNLQDGRRLQFQSGQSAIYTRVTARFVMAMYLEKLPSWVYSCLSRPALTYIQQDIPAPYQMPAFECDRSDRHASLVDTIASLFRGTYKSDLERDGNPFDFSGTRVRCYVQMVSWCAELRAIKRYLSIRRRKGQELDYTLQPIQFAACPKREMINYSMNRLRKKRDTNVFTMARQFASRVVRTWRHLPPVAELLMLPVSVLDETTKVGASGVVLDFMTLHGLLEWDDHNKIYKPAASWNDKWLFIVGDGLSIDRIFQFFDDVMAITDSKTVSFRQAYRQAMAISRVIHRVVPITGDLHVRFHMLESIYRLFYGGFLQCFQHRLKWKRLDPIDVSNSYRLCHRLVALVYEETERLMFDVFVCNAVKKVKIEDLLKGSNGGEDLAVYLAKTYLAFLNREVRESPHWLRRYLCNFLLITKKYMRFLEAEQHGDAISMEAMVVEYLPYFYATNKRNSFNTQLRLMELYYHGIPILVLQQLRLNRTKRQKPASVASAFQKESALDQIMERLMPFFKGMNHLGTEASFIKVSQMLTACQRAKHFVEFYTRGRADGMSELAERVKEEGDPAEIAKYNEEALADPGQRNKRTTYPKSELNRVLVTELLVLAKCYEVPRDSSSVIDRDHFWRALDLTTLKVQKKLRRCGGDGKVEADTTHQYVLCQAQAMMGPLSKAKNARVGEETGDNREGDQMDVDETEDDEEIDLEKAMNDQDEELENAMKDQDGEESVGDRSYFSIGETVAVVEVMEDTSGYGTQPSVEVFSDKEDDNDEEWGNSQEDTVFEEDEEQIPETQLEDAIEEEAAETTDETEDVDDNRCDEVDEDAEDASASQEEEDNEEGADSVEKDQDDGLIEKSAVKGMKVVPMNVIASKDVVAVALEEIAEKNVITARGKDVERKEREEHFLRYKLYVRLEEMEDDGETLGWLDTTSDNNEQDTLLERSLAAFERFRNE